MKPKLIQHEQVRRSMDRTSPGFVEENENEVAYGVRHQMKTTEMSEFNTFVCDEADASEESPTTLPSNQFHYIMTVNNSKLARKTYYKSLMKNHFEPQFCAFLDFTYGQVISYADLPSKLQILYQVFSEASHR
jgi:hypothetical protein